jgi:catechol 2,3-dioxygenase-like lactoylglutathione lyase family enzyme
VGVTGLTNLAVKVADLEAALEFYRAAGFRVTEPITWEGARRAEAFVGPLQITLFTRAIYEDAVALPPDTFLHPALLCDDLDAQLVGHQVLWGPAVVRGDFGVRRIAFVAAPGGMRLEFMEQLEPAPADPPQA